VRVGWDRPIPRQVKNEWTRDNSLGHENMGRELAEIEKRSIVVEILTES